MGQTLANHSYVDLSAVGSASDNSDSVVCHTDLSTCYTDLIMETGISLMEVYLPFTGRSVPIGLGRTAQIAVIRRTTATELTGIYRCDIPVHDDTDIISVRDAIYVGLYVSGGELSLPNSNIKPSGVK